MTVNNSVALDGDGLFTLGDPIQDELAPAVPIEQTLGRPAASR